MRQADPTKVTRCYYCGAKLTLAGKKKKPTIFHKPGCKPAETKLSNGLSEAEEMYPGIDHGGYVTMFSL